MTSDLFTGAESLRDRAEHARLILTIVALPLSLATLGVVFHNEFTVRSLLLIVVGALVLVALGRGRFLGAGVRLGSGHFGEAYAVVEECSRLIGTEVPHVFLREDLFTPVVAIGTGEPYALAISAQWIELFSAAELRFAVGRELAHIAAGHAKITSLLSANGRENVFVSLAFGPWLRTIEYTGDRVGLLCCGSMASALSAIAVSTFGHAGRRIDVESFARQRRELEAEPALRMGEWLASTPYVTNRIARLADFASRPLYLAWRRRFDELDAQRGRPPRLPQPRRSPFAGPVRRWLAFVVDATVVALLVPLAHGARESHIIVADPAEVKAIDRDLLGPNVPSAVGGVLAWTTHHLQAIVHAVLGSVELFTLLAYAVVLVGLAGQTLGMLICDVRVVDARYGRRTSLGGACLRYLFGILSFFAFVGFFAMFRRVQPFERWSKTRLVVGNALPENG